MTTLKLRLWLLRSTNAAHCFSTVPPDSGRVLDSLWIPRSIIEHITKRPTTVEGIMDCDVTVPEWFAEKKGLL
jgi:hypothetical protein